ncbi:MAG TPA: hypothetical protein VK173_06405 [Lacibacter sp.]|nr:hypothetical protein [Lacibacter sp.]
MRKTTALFVSLSLALASCTGNENSTTETTASGSDTAVMALTSTEEEAAGVAMVSVDTANIMINSYLNSINYTQNDSSLHSVIINADALRAYLNSPGGQTVHNLKIMLAHTMNYINNGGKDQYAYYNSGELTFILVGFNDSGNYVINGDKVLDHGSPCPVACPPVGSATRDTFTR